MSYPITHVTVKNTPPPQRPVMTIGHLYPITQETVFKTVNPEFTSDDEDDEKGLDEAETKVVRRGRRPKPQANEDVDTK